MSTYRHNSNYLANYFALIINYVDRNSIFFKCSLLLVRQPLTQIRNDFAISLVFLKRYRSRGIKVEFVLNILPFSAWLAGSRCFCPSLPAQGPRGVLQVLSLGWAGVFWVPILLCPSCCATCGRAGQGALVQQGSGERSRALSTCLCSGTNLYHLPLRLLKWHQPSWGREGSVTQSLALHTGTACFGTQPPAEKNEHPVFTRKPFLVNHLLYSGESNLIE